jgi:hypothetical protein
MTSDPLHSLWHSAANQPGATAGERFARDFLVKLRRRRRFQAWWLGWTFVALTAASVVAGVQLFREGTGAAAQQWALFPLLALPWALAVHFLRGFIRQKAGAPASGLPLRHALVAARESNRRERRHLALVGWLIAGLVPVLGLAVWQLRLVGKAPGNQAWSMALTLGVLLALGATGMLVRYCRYLRTEKLVIEDRLRELDDPVTAAAGENGRGGAGAGFR